MADIPKLDHPVYDEYDLGGMGAELAGKRLRVLRNPTIRFRAGFRSASFTGAGNEWAAYLAAILDTTVEKLMDVLGDFEQAVILGLFTSTYDSYDADLKALMGERPAHIFRVWDEYAAEKRKTFGARS